MLCFIWFTFCKGIRLLPFSLIIYYLVFIIYYYQLFLCIVPCLYPCLQMCLVIEWKWAINILPTSWLHFFPVFYNFLLSDIPLKQSRFSPDLTNIPALIIQGKLIIYLFCICLFTVENEWLVFQIRISVWICVIVATVCNHHILHTCCHNIIISTINFFPYIGLPVYTECCT